MSRILESTIFDTVHEMPYVPRLVFHPAQLCAIVDLVCSPASLLNLVTVIHQHASECAVGYHIYINSQSKACTVSCPSVQGKHFTPPMLLFS